MRNSDLLMLCLLPLEKRGGFFRSQIRPLVILIMGLCFNYSLLVPREHRHCSLQLQLQQGSEASLQTRNGWGHAVGEGLEEGTLGWVEFSSGLSSERDGAKAAQSKGLGLQTISWGSIKLDNDLHDRQGTRPLYCLHTQHSSVVLLTQ